jgi:hypothetical protein
MLEEADDSEEENKTTVAGYTHEIGGKTQKGT